MKHYALFLSLIFLLIGCGQTGKLYLADSVTPNPAGTAPSQPIATSHQER